MKLEIRKGTTSKTQLIFVPDSSSSVGAGLTGLAFGTSGLTWYYYREAQGTGGTSVTLATMTLGTWASGGFKEVDATNMPGWYELGIPNAALAIGADFVGMQLKGAANMAPVNLEIQLIDSPTVKDAIASGTPSTTSFIGSSALSSSDDFYNGCFVVFLTGACAGIARKVTDYVGSSRTFTTQAFPTAPSVSDVFEIIGNVPA